jgi:hypothetical protein
VPFVVTQGDIYRTRRKVSATNVSWMVIGLTNGLWGEDP